jgi:hypothetical protein
MHYADKRHALSNMEAIEYMNIDGFRRCWFDAADIIHDEPYKKSPEVDGYYETYVTESCIMDMD